MLRSHTPFAACCVLELASPGCCRSPEAEKPVIQAKLREAEAGLAEELGDAPAAHAGNEPAAGAQRAAISKTAQARSVPVDAPLRALI